MENVQIPTILNNNDLNVNDQLNELIQKNYIHIRIQQRNGRKTLTTIQGLSGDIDEKKITKAFKKEFACNGCIVNHPELGEIIQLQGDQRENVKNFLIYANIATDEIIKVHGF